MAKDGKKKKVQSRTTPKYTTSSDEGSSSDSEDDLMSLFANLNMEQKKKLNELTRYMPMRCYGINLIKMH
jgi:hypothetical protein